MDTHGQHPFFAHNLDAKGVFMVKASNLQSMATRSGNLRQLDQCLSIVVLTYAQGHILFFAHNLHANFAYLLILRLSNLWSKVSCRGHHRLLVYCLFCLFNGCPMSIPCFR